METMASEGSSQGHVDRILAHSRKARRDAVELGGALELLAEEARSTLVDQLQQRPYATLGVAVGLGYLIGAVLPRSGGAALRAGGRIATHVAISRAMEALSSGSSGSDGG